jgi:hypothetical protein
MQDSRKISSPCEPGVILERKDQALEENSIEPVDFPYRELCGAAIYLRTRPDVTHCVSKLCKWMANPGPKMIAAAQRLMRYLNSHATAGISLGINRAKCLNEDN